MLLFTIVIAPLWLFCL